MVDSMIGDKKIKATELRTEISVFNVKKVFDLGLVWFGSPSFSFSFSFFYLASQHSVVTLENKIK